MAYISSNYVYILFVCASSVISSECEIQQKKNDAFYFSIQYISPTDKRYCRKLKVQWRKLDAILILDLILFQILTPEYRTVL